MILHVSQARQAGCPVLVLVLAASWPVRANSQDTDSPAAVDPQDAPSDAAPAQVEEARRLFLEGIEFGRRERWADAARSFEASLNVLPRASSAFNLASALYRLGRIVEAQAFLERYRSLAAPDDPNHQAAVALLGELSLAMARITLYLDPPESQVVIDGKHRAGEGRLRELPMDPGVHSLEVRARGYHSYVEQLRVSRGQPMAREIALDPLPAPETVVVEVQAEERPIYKKPVFWVAVGAAVLAAGGTAVAVALSTDKIGEPYGGSIGLVLTGPSGP